MTLCVALSAIPLLSGCVAAIGNRTPTEVSVGQQLIDLQKAKEAGAMTEAEYQAERAKVLGHK
jgi:hypothetical protein